VARTQFIDNQQFVASHSFLEAQQPFFVLGIRQLMHIAAAVVKRTR
jgi:hypothetical protein